MDIKSLVAIDMHTHAEVAAYYRERKMACVIFPVDMESTTGIKRVPNEEVAEVAAENADVLIPFASIDPAKGKMGVREARRLITQFGVKGFKFHPSVQEFYPNDRNTYETQHRKNFDNTYRKFASSGRPGATNDCQRAGEGD